MKGRIESSQLADPVFTKHDTGLAGMKFSVAS